MNCERFEALLMDFMEGALSKEDTQTMQRHMSECPACQRSYDEMRTILHDLDSMDSAAQVPADWKKSWRETIYREEKENMQKQTEVQKKNPWRTWVSAAAAVVVLAAGSLAAREWVPASQTEQEEAGYTTQLKTRGASNGADDTAEAPSWDADMLYAAVPSPEAAPGTGSYESKRSIAASLDQGMAGSDQQQTVEAVKGVKIIRTLSYTLATMQFDQDLNAIKSLATSFDGWVEYASVTGDKIRGDLRYAYLTLRVPTGNLDSFKTGITGIGRLTGSNESATDVSESYADTQMRLKTQKDKMDRLRKLMETTGELADLLAVENEIANTQYQIDSYESSLRSTDSKVNYTSIQISLNEETAGEAAGVKTLTLIERIRQGLTATWHAIGEFFQDMTVFLFMVLPVLIPLALVVYILLRVYKARKRKHTQQS